VPTNVTRTLPIRKNRMQNFVHDRGRICRGRGPVVYLRTQVRRHRRNDLKSNIVAVRAGCGPPSQLRHGDGCFAGLIIVQRLIARGLIGPAQQGAAVII
jgi:hypothetical protein